MLNTLKLFGLVSDDVLYYGILLVEKPPRGRAVLESFAGRDYLRVYRREEGPV